MTIILWIIGAVVYLFIGAVIAGLLESKDIELLCFFMWPIVIVFGLPMIFCVYTAEKTSDIKRHIEYKIKSKR